MAEFEGAISASLSYRRQIASGAIDGYVTRNKDGHLQIDNPV